MSAQDVVGDPMERAALKYAEAGFPVFPCRVRDKRPLTRHGLKDASRDPATIKSWWGRTREGNIGVPMGPPSNLFALDVDGPKGETALTALEGEHGHLPSTLEQRTGRGRHLLFRYPPNGTTIPSSVSKLGAELDVRGAGGYVIFPPSVHPGGHRYKWRDGHSPTDMEPADAPPWLLDLVVQKPPPTTTKRPEWKGNGGGGPYAEAALEREAEAVANATEGTRNHTLTKAAHALGQFVGSGALSAERVESELTRAALHAGLDPGETRNSIASGLSAGVAKPREVPERVPRDKRPKAQDPSDDQTKAAVANAKVVVADLAKRAKADKGAPF
ncbi:MAG: bifunctional DNA primase/polymerase [Alphaproteobacteria bacterium]